jgi:hypothetical protein
MKKKYPLTCQYLRQFQEMLAARPGYRKYFDPGKDPFWTIYNVGPYSVAPFRVIFKELTDFFQCAVVESLEKPAVADTKLRFIECRSSEEGHFLCGLLNSPPAVLYLYATATWVQTADYQASDISRLRLPRFNASDRTHSKIAAISQRCHKAKAEGDAGTLARIEESLDGAAMCIWGIEEKEMKAIRAALEDIGFYAEKGQEQENDD